MQHPPPTAWPGGQYPPNPMMAASMMMMPSMMPGAIGSKSVTIFSKEPIHLKCMNYFLFNYNFSFVFSSEWWYEGRACLFSSNDGSTIHIYLIIFCLLYLFRLTILTVTLCHKTKKFFGQNTKLQMDEHITTIKYQKNLGGRNPMN